MTFEGLFQHKTVYDSNLWLFSSGLRERNDKRLSSFLLVYIGGPILFLLTDWFVLNTVSSFMRIVLLLCFPSLEWTKVRLCDTGKGSQSKHWATIFPSLFPSPHQIAHASTKCQHKLMMGCADDSGESRAMLYPTRLVNTMKIPITHVARRAWSVLVAGSLCTDEKNNRVAEGGGLFWFSYAGTCWKARLPYLIRVK